MFPILDYEVVFVCNQQCSLLIKLKKKAINIQENCFKTWIEPDGDGKIPK